MFKEKIKKCIITYQENLVSNLEMEFQNTKQTAHIDEADVRDADTHSHQSQTIADEQRISEQLIRAKQDLEKLKSISTSPSHKIEEGAIIETRNLLIHVGIVTSKFNEEGKDIIGISTDAPIYKTLHGQKKGFPFEFAGTACEILSIL